MLFKLTSHRSLAWKSLIASLSLVAPACGRDARSRVDEPSGTGGQHGTDQESEYCRELRESGALLEYQDECTDPVMEEPIDTPPPLTEEERKQQLMDGWNQVAPLPRDTRPAAPEWEAPFDLGAPGWKDSADAFCQPFAVQPNMNGLWADSRGVFAAVARHCGATLSKEQCDSVDGSVIYHNDGTGWQIIASPATRLPKLTAAFKEGAFLFGLDVLFDLEAGPTFLDHPLGDVENGDGAGIAVSGSRALAMSRPEFSLDSSAPSAAKIFELVGAEWQQVGELGGSWGSLALDPAGAST